MSKLRSRRTKAFTLEEVQKEAARLFALPAGATVEAYEGESWRKAFGDLWETSSRPVRVNSRALVFYLNPGSFAEKAAEDKRAAAGATLFDG